MPRNPLLLCGTSYWMHGRRVLGLGESLVEFAERIQRLVQRALPGISSQALAPFAVDCFLRGCQEKAAAVLAMERQPQTVPKALQVLNHILDSHQAIYGPNSVSFPQLKQVAEPRLRTPPRPDAEECATKEGVQQLALKVEGMLTSHVDPSRSLEQILSGAVLSMAVSRPMVANPPLGRRSLLKQRAIRPLQPPTGPGPPRA